MGITITEKVMERPLNIFGTSRKLRRFSWLGKLLRKGKADGRRLSLNAFELAGHLNSHEKSRRATDLIHLFTYPL